MSPLFFFFDSLQEAVWVQSPEVHRHEPSPSAPGRAPGGDTHSVRVVDHQRVRVAVVGRVGVRVVAQPGEHGSYVGHVLQHVPRDVPDPFR